MAKDNGIKRVRTGIRNLDAILDGGFPENSVVVVGGSPGAGKTILTQQIIFQNASPERPALYLGTLSEPLAKSLTYLRQFQYFSADKVGTSIHFVDLGGLVRDQGLGKTMKLIMEQLKRVKPAYLVIDSFKVFKDLSKSPEENRKFGYELVVNLAVWQCTTFLLGEYGPEDYLDNPIFSAVDGIVSMSNRESSGEQQRFIQVLKMRGCNHSQDEYPFQITGKGVDVFAPRVTLRREPRGDANSESRPRLTTGISKLDSLLGEGIPRGSSLLVSGVSGTGKTPLLLEFLYRGAQKGEKGIFFSFEETAERLHSVAKGMGFDLNREIKRGMIELVFIPQPEIQVERHLLMMHEKVVALQASRISVDSASVFLDKVKDLQKYREKMFQLATVVQNQEAVGLFATDIPYGANQLSHMGIEETVVDGVILLTATEEAFERQRYIEIYKLRNTAHIRGRHRMSIARGGISILPRSVKTDSPKDAGGTSTRKKVK